MVSKCPVCGLLGLHRECNAAFAASLECVTVWGSNGLKCAVVCYFQRRIFSPSHKLIK